MVRGCLWVVAVLGCAPRPSAKMAWPQLPDPTPSPTVETGGGVGGGLEAVSPPTVAAPDALAEDPPGTLVFRWPVPLKAINSLYGYRVDPLNGTRRFHSGIDLDGAYGQVVGASARGRVIAAGWRFGHGRQVVLEHSGGFRSSYSHLAQVLVEEGAVLEEGQALGMLGNSGRSTAPHLHFEISRHGEPLDPLDLLGQSLTVD